MARALLLAFQFLTRLPVPVPGPLDERLLGRSLIFYPLVGLVLGGLLALLGALVSGVSTLLAAALVLGAWVMLTGALHLDGLADSADAWLGGQGDRERTLAIMKDPRCGTAAVVTLVIVLLLKFASLQHLLAAQAWATVVAALLLGRIGAPLLLLTTPYVRPGGLGAALVAQLPRRGVLISVLLGAALVPVLAGVQGAWLLASAGAMFWLLRRLMLQRLHGTTGDTTGAVVELVETAVLVMGSLTGGLAP